MDDWYAWLSRAGLGEDLAAEYAALFERNELGAADLRHLDHAFLATMGVAVAKHRLEILKLARKESSAASSSTIAVLPWRASRLLAAATHRSVRSVTECLRSAVARRDRRAAVAPRPLALCQQRGVGGGRAGAAGSAWLKGAPTAVDGRGGGTRRKLAAFLTRVGKPMLMLTNISGKEVKEGTAPTTRRSTSTIAAAAGCFSSRDTSSDYDADDDEEEEDDEMDEDPEAPWESLFHNLNPT